MNREEALTKIKAELSCADYLEKSAYGMYCCPFCGSGHGPHHTGALKVYTDTNTWYCHACDKHGDVLDLIAHEYSTDFTGALQIAADKLGISIDKYSNSVDGSIAHEEKTDFVIPDTAADTLAFSASQCQENTVPIVEEPYADYKGYYELCQEYLKNSPPAQEYLQKRGISVETALKYLIGFDPASDPANAPGAVGNEVKKHPAPRLIIPTRRSHYIARAIDKDISPSFRVMNPSMKMGAGSPGIFNAKALYGKESTLFVVEGWADALSVIEAGGTAVALNSTSNTEALLSMLRDKPVTDKKFIISLDNDSDPQTAARTEKAAKELASGLQMLNIPCILANVSGTYKDENEALVHDKKSFAANVAAAIQQANRDYMSDFLDKIQTEAYKPYETDLQFFDNLLGGGIIQQSLLLLMAAPGTGKTTLCQQLAEAMAVHGKQIIYLNFEMSREQMISKAISSRLARKGYKKTSLDILQGYKWDADERRQIVEEIEEYRHDSFPYIRYNPSEVSSDIEAIETYLTQIGNAAKQGGQQAPAVVVDYLHLITGKGLDVQELIKKSVMVLKTYAKNYDTFVIAIAATNRDSNKSGKISLSSGRDSSNLEYTADYHLSLNYEAIDNGSVKPDDADAIAKLQMQPLRKMIIRVLKNRSGIPGRKAIVYFDAANNNFFPADTTTPEPAEETYKGKKITARF